MTFWQHLEIFRGVLWKALLAVMIVAVAAFCLKDLLFSILFAPSKPDFVLYRAMCRLATLTDWSALCPNDFDPHFINTELAQQFMIHLEVALWTGLLVASPYIIYLLYGFVAPALYEQEKKHSIAIVSVCMLLFFAGVLLNYFLIFPFSFRFLSTYQVQPEVINQISLSSYISAFLMLSLLMGIMFELPILAYLLARIGLLNTNILKKYRRHAFVAICIVAAVITPTGDAVTLMLVTLPVYALYELSILIVSRTRKQHSSTLLSPD